MSGKGPLQPPCAAAFFFSFINPPEKVVSLLPVPDNRGWKCGLECCVLHPWATDIAPRTQEESKAMDLGRNTWKQRLDGFYFGISSLLGWPRRWKIRFSALTFPEWLILQGAGQELDVLHKGKPALAGPRAVQAREGTAFVWLSPSASTSAGFHQESKEILLSHSVQLRDFSDPSTHKGLWDVPSVLHWLELRSPTLRALFLCPGRAQLH